MRLFTKVMVVLYAGLIAFAFYGYHTWPTAPWQIGDEVCFKLHGEKARVTNYSRWWWGVQYEVAAVDSLNRVYNVKVDYTALGPCN